MSFIFDEVPDEIYAQWELDNEEIWPVRNPEYIALSQEQFKEMLEDWRKQDEAIATLRIKYLGHFTNGCANKAGKSTIFNKLRELGND